MQSFIPHIISGNTFLLTANKTIFWEEEKTLILSDLHLGKSGHFRKAGIAIPQNILQQDLFRFLAEIQFYKPKQIIIVGDLFHSHANKEHDLFYKWRNDIANINIHLVMGNHDILQQKFYKNANMQLHQDTMSIGNFIFAHDIKDINANEEKYCFSGHIHPSLQLSGVGKQNLRLPCFYFTKTYAVLPAFGKFTGTFNIIAKPGDAVFALVNNSIIKM